MMEKENLEKEFTLRKFSHEFAILGAYLTLKTLKNNDISEEEAVEKATKDMQKYVATGTFKQKYERAYKKLAPLLNKKDINISTL